MTRKDLGLLLREMREKAGMNQAVLGARLDRSQSAISKAEIGETGLHVEEIGAWVSTCGRQLVLRLGTGAPDHVSQEGLEGLPENERELLLRLVGALTRSGPTKPLVLAQMEVIARGVEQMEASLVVGRMIDRVQAASSPDAKRSGA